MTTVAEIVISADVAAWRRVGLLIDNGGRARIGTVTVRFVDPATTTGIVSWTLYDAPSDDVDSVDGLPTTHVDSLDRVAVAADASSDSAVPLDVLGFDHIVVMTSDLERTCGAIEESTGAPLKRIREVGPMRQGFHRLGEVIVEVVNRPDIPEGPAAFWGFVINVGNIDAVAEHLGPDVLTPPKQAVQPGRRISSFRHEAGLGLPVALMTA